MQVPVSWLFAEGHLLPVITVIAPITLQIQTAKCHHCGKVGHIQKACRSKAKAQGQVQKGKKNPYPRKTHQVNDHDSDEDGCYDIFQCT